MSIVLRFMYLFKAGMDKNPDVHRSHLPAILPVIVDQPGEYFTDNSRRQQLHPASNLLCCLLLLLRQTQQAPADRIFLLGGFLPDNPLQPGGGQRLQGGNCLA